jgi:hypothetical protein
MTNVQTSEVDEKLSPTNLGALSIVPDRYSKNEQHLMSFL